MTPPSKEHLIHTQRITDKEFAYSVTEFMNPWEDLMVHTNAIHQHLTTLNFIVREFNLKSILEIGVQRGYSTVAFGYAIKDNGGELFSVDIAPCPEARDKMGLRGLVNDWNFKESLSSDNLRWKKDIDLLFIDSEHSYKRMLTDLKHFEPFVKKNGFIVLHDVVVYRKEGMTKAISEYFDNFENPKKYRYYRWFNDCGLGVIRKL